MMESGNHGCEASVQGDKGGNNRQSLRRKRRSSWRLAPRHMHEDTNIHNPDSDLRVFTLGGKETHITKFTTHFVHPKLFPNLAVLGLSMHPNPPDKPRGLALAGTRPQREGGADPPPPLRTPKLSYGTMCFVGARGAGDFVLGIGQGEIFLFDPMCLYSKYSEFRGEFKNG